MSNKCDNTNTINYLILMILSFILGWGIMNTYVKIKDKEEQQIKQLDKISKIEDEELFYMSPPTDVTKIELRAAQKIISETTKSQ